MKKNNGSVSSGFIISTAISLALLIVVGTMDKNDAVQAQTSYVTKFCQGIHPDYKSINPECSGIEVLEGLNKPW